MLGGARKKRLPESAPEPASSPPPVLRFEPPGAVVFLSGTRFCFGFAARAAALGP